MRGLDRSLGCAGFRSWTTVDAGVGWLPRRGMSSVTVAIAVGAGGLPIGLHTELALVVPLDGWPCVSGLVVLNAVEGLCSCLSADSGIGGLPGCGVLGAAVTAITGSPG
jgi:hypothetical protein